MAQDALCTALNDQEPRIRSAAAWAIARRRDRGLDVFLQDSLESEKNEEVRVYMKAAQQALKGGWPREFENFKAKVMELKKGAR